jgi:adenylylsulfate kinase
MSEQKLQSCFWQDGSDAELPFVAPGSGRKDLVFHHSAVTRSRREGRNGHRSAVVWFTGLSGAGKSTLAHAVEEQLFQRGCQAIVLDGDNVRFGLCGDLGFSPEDRNENIRRVGELSKLFVGAGLVTLTAFISPQRSDRRAVRRLIGNSDFIEVYMKCPLSVCESRDVKGMYARARAGIIREFTGISSPYEEPEAPELVLDSSELDLNQSIARVIGLLADRGVFGPAALPGRTEACGDVPVMKRK